MKHSQLALLACIVLYAPHSDPWFAKIMSVVWFVYAVFLMATGE